jgi:hypothetical protein
MKGLNKYCILKMLRIGNIWPKARAGIGLKRGRNRVKNANIYGLVKDQDVRRIHYRSYTVKARTVQLNSTRSVL